MDPFKLQQRTRSAEKQSKGFRNVKLIPMETSSSSDDSCDSFGSDNFANTKPKLRSDTSRELAKHFHEDSDNEPFGDFSDHGMRGVMKLSDVNVNDFPEDAFKKPERVRPKRCAPLKVALKFPVRKNTRNQTPQEPPETPANSSHSDSDSEDEHDSNFMEKRALNIKENKAMLAKLMAELKSIPGFAMKRNLVSPSTPKSKRSPRTPRSGRVLRSGSDRLAPPRTRSRSLVDGPPSPAPEEEENDQFYLVRKSKLEDEYLEEESPRRSRPSALTFTHVVRPVEEVTEEELENISTNASDKVYNSVTGSTCHQCRQKTIDTKTNCRNPDCVGVRGQFCGPCLKNRYGEYVKAALLDPDWQCPPCRGICNCSFCRQRNGRCATGVLVYLAKHHGYDNVHAYLKSLKRQLEMED
ncbi:cell division cycle-associated protein 7 [Lissotriton helveticus]